MPVREMGLIATKVLRKAHRERRINEVQASELQDVLLRDPSFRPVRHVPRNDGSDDVDQVPNREDPRFVQVKAEFGADVAEAVLQAFLELDEWNPSGRYTVRIPWDERLGRELQPAEVTQIILAATTAPARKPKRARQAR